MKRRWWEDEEWLWSLLEDKWWEKDDEYQRQKVRENEALKKEYYENHPKNGLKDLPRECALAVIKGGPYRWAFWKYRLSKHHSKEDARKYEDFKLALFRDNDIKKAREIAKTIKDPVLRKDCFIEIEAFRQACIQPPNE